MSARNARRMLLLAVLAGLFLAVRTWLHDATAPAASRDIPALPHAPAPTADTAAPRAVAVDPRASQGDVRQTPRTAAATARMHETAVRLDVRAPVGVGVGDVFEVRIVVDARTPVRDLVFAIAYEKSRLSLVGRSEGEFVRQPGIRAEYGVDEPSDGYVGVVFRAVDGSFATGTGNVIVLEFEAIRTGTSRIELRNVESVGAGGEPNRNIVVTHASVTIH